MPIVVYNMLLLHFAPLAVAHSRLVVTCRGTVRAGPPIAKGPFVSGIAHILPTQATVYIRRLPHYGEEIRH
jgi:hypothetical protein